MNQHTPRTSRRTLTCGAELEFLMPNHHGSETAYAPLVVKLALAIKRGCSEPVAAVCHHQESEQRCLVCVAALRAEDVLDQETVIFKHPSSPDAISWGRHFPPKHTFYVVKAEDETQAALRRGPQRAIELATPVFRKKDVDDCFVSLRNVFGALLEKLNDIDYDASCGLHIHTGFLDGVSVFDAKRLITLMFMLEYVFFREIIPKHGQASHGASLIRDSGFGAGTHGSRRDEETCPADMAAHLPWGSADPPVRAWNGRNPRRWRNVLRRVWNSSSLVDLARGIRQHDEYWKPLSFVIRLRDAQGKPIPEDEEPRDDCPRSTFEFRYPSMTFEPKFVQFWLEICNKLTEIASLPANEYKQWIDSFDCDLHTSDGAVSDAWAQEHGFPKPEVRALLTEMRLRHVAVDWRTISENPSEWIGPVDDD
ncbi:hypothetical protein CDD80_3830 [Ophiocordyceps camponoti-rufipedis]|uniref:Amidoligase enzyme n=1 Tax=Ophiocordyceps camponoti-rufipedis TaxID=2004952 RepID=A0A2C5Y5R7_9HYPO|nr:hypothetical protein CDD80_3830 [Ophiocordyceps camponoti-rufipedis]